MKTMSCHAHQLNLVHQKYSNKLSNADRDNFITFYDLMIAFWFVVFASVNFNNVAGKSNRQTRENNNNFLKTDNFLVICHVRIKMRRGKEKDNEISILIILIILFIFVG